MASKKRFIPLESNPEVLTQYACDLGADMSSFSFCDVYGLDEELLAMVPSPVLALLLLFPLGSGSGVKGDRSSPAPGAPSPAPAELYFMRQTIGNACGTIGVLHALLNNTDRITFARGSFLEEFAAATAAMTPEERAAYLESPPAGAPDIEKSHEVAARQGSTSAPAADEEVDLHFVAFVHWDGGLYELDGRLPRAVYHGASSPGTVLQDTARVVRDTFIARASSHSFNLIALAGRF